MNLYFMRTPNISDQNCAYCDEIFTPKRRWTQKYCCESCRTLACRERKNGESGTLKSKSRSIGMNDLKGQIDSMRTIISLHQKHFQETIHKIYFMVSDLGSKYPDEDFNKCLNNIVLDQKRMQSELNKINLSIQESKSQNMNQYRTIQRKLSDQDLLTVLSSVFGSHVGKKILDLISGKNQIKVTPENLLKEILELREDLNSKPSNQGLYDKTNQKKPD